MQQINDAIKSDNYARASSSALENGEHGDRSLTSSLVLWFLLLALVPLSLVSFISYQQATTSLTASAIDNLEQIASKNAGFIESWFDYRVMDINVQAEAKVNVNLLVDLTQGWQRSGKELASYVRSYDWAKRVDASHDGLSNLLFQYDYVTDVFLVDQLGNIIFSAAQKDDFGKNLIDGVYAGTRFAKAVKVSLATGLTQFSDFERYLPSNNEVVGFITAPLLDEVGAKIGLVAIQLHSERVYNFLHRGASTTLHQYLVGEQGYLRSPIEDDETQVMNKKITSDQYQYWRKGNSELTNVQDGKVSNVASEYLGPDDNLVIGVHFPIQLLNVNWALISEVDRAVALRSALWLRNVMLALVLATTVVVMLLAVVIARKITRPIIELVKATRAMEGGSTEQQVNIDVDNEIGQLARAFNQMSVARADYELKLEENSFQTRLALKDLEKQKFALDQHAIVAITDIQGTITFANQRFVDITGFSEEELLGQNHRIVNSGLHEDDFWRDMYLTIGRGEVWHAEVCNQAKAGHLYWVDTTVVPFLDIDGKPKSYIAIRTEITKRKQTERALITAKEDAEAAVRAKSEFLASMSHEIRTPMNGVLGMLGLLQKTQLSADQQRKVNVVQSSAKSLLTVINDILDFSKVDAGKLELEELDFDICNLFEDIVESLALRVEQGNIELILDMASVDQSHVKGDPGRIRQIVVNLIGNAIKFTQRGEIVVRVQIRRTGPDELVMSCSVRDTGIGIPQEKRQALFEAFTQVDASTTREYGGTGLGLSIVKQLCELMGGSVSVASEVGEGSCFEFVVLLKNSNQVQMEVPVVQMDELSLLVVDDNATNRIVLREQLESWGVNVEEAEDGPTALSVMKDKSRRILAGEECRQFDVALLDMLMPGMNGAELGGMIKSDVNLAGIKLVMMTSMGDRGDAQFFADLGFSAYFSKPTTAANLFSALSIVVDGGDLLQQAEPLVTRHYVEDWVAGRTEDRAGGLTKSRLENVECSLSWQQNTRVLLVEDNLINQEVALGMLEDLGLQVETANNGCEALDILIGASEHEPFNLVLMDCQMPEMDGYEATRIIRAGEASEPNKNIPIIAMTANAMVGDREKCIAAGMSDYLSKPMEPEDLDAVLQKWLRVKSIATSATSKFDQPLAKKSLVTKVENKSEAVWDKAAVLKRLGGKEKYLLKLIGLFERDVEQKMAALQQASAEGDLLEVVSLSHTIKGVAANLSGLSVQAYASNIERAAKSKDISHVKALVPVLDNAYRALMVELNLYVKSHGDNCVPSEIQGVLSVAELINTLKSLEGKLRQGDFVDVDVLANLKAGHVDAGIQQQLNALLDHVGQFDIDAANQILADVLVKASSNVEPFEVIRREA